MDDSTTINAILAGDKERYSELIERYQRTVFAIAWSRLGDRDLAEDASQETFVKGYQYLPTLRQRGRFGWWIARVARNVSLTFHRKRSREIKTAQAFASAPESESVTQRSDERDKSLWTAFAALPDTHREALTLFYVEGKSVADSATALGISEDAMKVRLHRARKALRNGIEAGIGDSIAALQPSARFNASVMAILPISPMGFINTAGITAVAAKIGAGLSFVFWMLLSQVAVMGVVSWLTAKLMQSGLRNTPDNAFRRKQIMMMPIRSMQYMVPMMAIILTVTPYMIARFGIDVFYELLALFCFGMTIKAAQRLKINTKPQSVIQVVQTAAMTIVCIAISLFHTPFWIFLLVIVGGLTVNLFYAKSGALRSDYNLFLRAATDGFGTEEPSETLPGRLTDTQFNQFAKFLGNNWLLNNYSITADGLRVLLTDVRSIAASGFAEHDRSWVFIARSGKCTAQISGRPHSVISQILGKEIDDQAVNTDVESALARAFACYVTGDAESALRILTVKSDSEIFVEPKGGHWRNVLYPIVLGLVALTIYLQIQSERMINRHQIPSSGLHLDSISGMPFYGDIYSNGEEFFSPVYNSVPLWFSTTLSVGPNVKTVMVDGLDDKSGYSVTVGQGFIKVAPSGNIKPFYGSIRLAKVDGSFVVDNDYKYHP